MPVRRPSLRAGRRMGLWLMSHAAAGGPPPDTDPPGVDGPMIIAADGLSGVITLDEDSDETSVPDPSDFALNGTPVLVDGVSFTDATHIELTFDSPILASETVTWDYTAGANPIQDLAGNDLPNVVGGSTDNNSGIGTTLEQQLFTVVGSTNWTSPAAGVGRGTAVVRGTGAGAGGNQGVRAGGGGARAGLNTFAYAPATAYPIVIPAGGAVGGNPGGNYTFDTSSCVAEGGGQSGTASDGGRSASCIGDFANSGGNGGVGAGTNISGGSAGTTTAAVLYTPGESDGAWGSLSTNNAAIPGSGGRSAAAAQVAGAIGTGTVAWTEVSAGVYSDIVGTSGSRDTANATTRDVVLPTGLVSGDRIRLFAAADGNPTISIGTGEWSTVASAASGTATSAAVFEAVYNPGSPPSLTLNTTASEKVSWRIVVERHSGAMTAAAPATGTSTAPDAPNHAPGAGAYRWYAVLALDGGGGSAINITSLPAGYDHGWLQPPSDDGIWLAVLYRTATAASENPGAAASINGAWVAITASSPRV